MERITLDNDFFNDEMSKTYDNIIEYKFRCGIFANLKKSVFSSTEATVVRDDDGNIIKYIFIDTSGCRIGYDIQNDKWIIKY